MTGLYTRLVSGLLFPLHERLKRHTSVAMKKTRETSQWLSQAKLEEHQKQRLHAFLADVKVRNRYFRNVMEQYNIDPAQAHDVNEWNKFPLLTKDIIRDNADNYLSDGADNPVFLSTSGSSGTPLKFAVGNERVSHDVAAKWRATRWWGVDIGDREAVIWGSDIELGGQGRVKQIRDYLFRSRLFPAQNLDEAGLGGLFEGLQSFNPAMIYGYPSILTLLAQYAKKHGLQYKGSALKVIFCTAEKLYDHQRDVIQSVFQAPVANGYGSRDAGFIAHECPDGGLHISAEDFIVEVLDDKDNPCAPGETGRLIVTNMTTADFPMIRYDTGDLARLSDSACGCGRGLPCFEEVVGRSNDVLYSENGAAVHGAYIGNVIREDNAVSHFQLIQEEASAFSLSLVSFPGKTPQTDRLLEKLHKVLGEGVNIECSLVDSIPAESTGKYKYIINRCH